MDAKRAARLDLSAYSEAEARVALDQARPAIEAEVRRHSRFLSDSGLGPEDLRAIAEVAVLEARLTWREGRNCTVRTWVGRTIRWRLQEAVKSERDRPEEPFDGADRIVNGHNPEAAVERVRAQQWVRTAIGELGPRHRVLIAAFLADETQKYTAATLGISRSRASREVRRAFEILRDRAEDDGVEPGE